jgi:hypothetical protein
MLLGSFFVLVSITGNGSLDDSTNVATKIRDGPAVAAQPFGCNLMPTSGRAGERVRLTITFVPGAIPPAVIQIHQMDPQALLGATAFKLQPDDGIRAQPVQFFTQGQFLVLQADFDIGSQARPGQRQVTIRIGPIPPSLPSPVEVACFQPFTVEMILRTDPQRLLFKEVPVDESSTEFVSIINLGLVPLSIFASVSGPFNVQLDDNVLPPQSARLVPVTFFPPGVGPFSGELIFMPIGAVSAPAKVQLEATAIALPPAPLTSDSVRINVIAEGHQTSLTTKVYDYTLVVPPLAPGKSRARLKFGLSGDIPPGATSSFLPGEVQLGLLNLAHFSLTIPQVAPGTPTRTYNFRVVGDVMVGSEKVATVFSDPITLPLFFQPFLECKCPEGTPPASLKELTSQTVLFPDAAPPMGSTPKASPVATVKAAIDGPQKGECCIGGKFRFRLEVTNQGPGHPSWPGGINGTSALFLVGGFCDKKLTAETKGNAHAISGTIQAGGGAAAAIMCPTPTMPGNIPGNLGLGGHTVRFSTQYEVPIICNGEDWPCSVAEKEYKTTFELSGAGKIEIHWRVDVGGKNCVIESVTATITRILFFRNNRVYDPKSDDYIDKDDDADKDGAKNYDEILKGTDPKDPKSKP